MPADFILVLHVASGRYNPGLSLVSFANAILLIGTSLEMAALLNLHQPIRPKTKKIYALFTACSMVGFQLLILLHNKEDMRIAYMAFVTAAIVLPAYRLVLDRLQPSMRVTGSFYLFAMIAFLIRGIVALQSADTASFFVPGIFQLISLLGIFLLTVLGSTAFVLLLKEKSDQALVQLASYDDLTGALNRKTFRSMRSWRWRTMRRRASPSLICFSISIGLKPLMIPMVTTSAIWYCRI